MSSITLEITETGFQTLTNLNQYMQSFLSKEQVEMLISRLVLESKLMLEDVPIRPVCQELAVLGIDQYRQLNLMGKYKILYRYDEDIQTAYIIAFMRQKQSAEKLLVDLSLNI